MHEVSIFDWAIILYLTGTYAPMYNANIFDWDLLTFDWDMQLLTGQVFQCVINVTTINHNQNHHNHNNHDEVHYNNPKVIETTTLRQSRSVSAQSNQPSQINSNLLSQTLSSADRDQNQGQGQGKSQAGDKEKRQEDKKQWGEWIRQLDDEIQRLGGQGVGVSITGVSTTTAGIFDGCLDMLSLFGADETTTPSSSHHHHRSSSDHNSNRQPSRSSSQISQSNVLTALPLPSQISPTNKDNQRPLRSPNISSKTAGLLLPPPTTVKDHGTSSNTNTNINTNTNTNVVHKDDKGDNDDSSVHSNGLHREGSGGLPPLTAHSRLPYSNLAFLTPHSCHSLHLPSSHNPLPVSSSCTVSPQQ